MTSTNLDDPVDIAAREDGVWDAYRLAFIINKQKLGSNGDTAHVAGLMAVYELGQENSDSEVQRLSAALSTCAVNLWRYSCEYSGFDIHDYITDVLNGTEDRS